MFGVIKKRTSLVVIALLSIASSILLLSTETVFSYTGSDGSVGDYCCRFQCCNGTWISVNCQSWEPASCSGVDKEWWCYYNDGYSDCPSDCTSGCNACASYSYLQSSSTNKGTKSVSCVDDCGDTDWDTCYCTSACTPTSCPLGTSESGSYGFYRTYACTNQCSKTYDRDCYCTSACEPTSCPGGTSESGTHGLYNTYNCTNACGQANSRSCYCTSSCSPVSCPIGKSETPSGHGFYQTYACTNGCSELQERDCYCTSHCTPPSCPSGTSETSEGPEYSAEPVSCSNDCGVTRERTCYCNTATCTDLESDVEWLDECPDETCRSVERSVPIPGAADSCPPEETKTCYVDNDEPEIPDIDNPGNGLDVEIILSGVSASTKQNLFQKLVRKVQAQSSQDSILGYSSNTHTGTQLNNPLRVTAEFRDNDGVDDLQALYIWWSTSESKDFVTPNQLGDSALGGKTQDNENFGFMITRHVNGNWENLYRPYIDGGTTRWVQEETPSPTSITILGSNEQQMLNISNITVASDANMLTLEFTMEFIWEGSDYEKVLPANYNIWGLANDTTGFLPFGDDEVIQDSGDEHWKDSGTNWEVDLEDPITTNSLTTSNITETEIAVRFGVRDDDNDLARVRLDACRTVNEANPPDLIIDGRTYDLLDCDDVNWGTHSPTDLNMESGNNLLGENPVNPSAQQYSISEPPLVVDLNGNENGSLTFYLTFMDEAGNWYQTIDILRLGEWVAVKDAFVFGLDGVSSATRVLDEDWDNNPLIKSNYGFEYDKIDLTDEVLMGGHSSTSSFLGMLERTDPDLENGSFKVSRYSGVFLNSAYAELIDSYEDRIAEDAISNYGEVTTIPPTLTGDILDQTECSGKDYCILRREGNLTIDSGSECVGNGLIAVQGDLTIDPNFKNGSDSDRCILLVSGNVIIREGDHSGVNPKVDYDEIQAFIIAAGQIQIEYDAELDGLVVEGGLTTFNSSNLDIATSINNLRTIDLDYRNKHPVLAVKGNPKYGLLAKTLFGSQTDVFRVDIGFKPY